MLSSGGWPESPGRSCPAYWNQIKKEKPAMKSRTLLVVLVGVGSVLAQTPPPQQKESTPLYRFTVVARSTKAINYRHRSGATKVDFRGTALLPEARGEARVESRRGAIEVEAQFDHLQPAPLFGPE